VCRHIVKISFIGPPPVGPLSALSGQLSLPVGRFPAARQAGSSHLGAGNAISP